MATTQTTYTGNGSTTNYSFTFEYLKQADVKVTLDTVATTAFTFANATTLAFTTAPANGVAIRIFRDTVIDTLSSTFFPGSAIKAEDLNENFTQNLYVTQESDAEALIATTTANGAVTTANAATATANGAVTTANAADTKSDAAVATANTASTTASSAVTTANAATATANTASSAAASAVTTANTASTNATAAVNTSNTASTNASAAVTTANSAQTDATSAVNTANAATTTANNAVTTANSAVTTANTANTNATAAQSAATTAQTSATAAQTSATAAQTSATAAQAQATLAADVRNAFTITDSNSDGTFDFVVGDIPIKGNNGVKLPFESVTYAEEGAIRYNNSLDKIELYNGAGQWVTAAGGAAVSSSPPSLPSAGDVWYDHDNGRAYVYYNDGDSNQWVEMNPSWNGYVADNSISSAKIIDGAIVDADVNASAAIAGTKISPNFGSQNVITTGNVGIGDSSPSYKLTLKRTDASGAYFYGAASSDNGARGLQFTSSDNGIYLGAIHTIDATSSGGQIAFATGNTERMRIDSAGNVGVGTTSNLLPSSTRRTLSLNHTGSAAVALGVNGTREGHIYVDASSMEVSAQDNYMYFTAGSAERMRIDSSGNLGIGTSNPNAKLHIAGAGDTSLMLQTTNAVDNNEIWEIQVAGNASNLADLIFRSRTNAGTGGSEAMRITSSGNLGLGTTSPAAPLAVLSTSSNYQGMELITPAGDGSGEFIFGVHQSGSSAGRNIVFKRGGTDGTASESMRIDSSGRLGLGTSSPSGLLSIHEAASSTSNYINITNNATGTSSWGNGMLVGVNAAGDALCWQNESSNLLFGTSNSERFRVDSSGNVIIGTTTAATNSELTVRATSPHLSLYATPGNDSRLNMGDTDNHDIGLIAYANSDNSMRFTTNATERMRIQNNGTLFIRSESTAEALSVRTTQANGNANLIAGFNSASSAITTGGTNVFAVRQNGDVKNTNNSYGALSDIKLKENIVDANSQWDDLKAIQVRNYNFIEGQTHTQIGVVAQEVELVSPGLVSESPDTDSEGTDLGTVTKSVNYSVLYMKAVKALQEAMERIETLETKVTALEGA